MKRKISIILAVLFSLGLSSVNAQKSPYYFDSNGISRDVLERYLDRSATLVYLLIPDRPEGRREFPYHADDVRMAKNLGAKFMGRALYRWGGESRLNDPQFWASARAIADDLHAHDPEIIIQGCLFEVITKDVNNVPVPADVFEAFGIQPEQRNFSYDAMLAENGRLVNHWGLSSVPDISRPETKMWFYYLVSRYMETGCEAFHLGQIELIGMNDPDREHWADIIGKIRECAKTKSRRGWVLLDAHTPYGGMVKDGVSLIDFNSFPLRIKETPDSPMGGCLEMNHLDSLYGKSRGCRTPSGWECEHLPYLVEFDNYGRGPEPGKADVNSHFVWGYDEISWLSLQDEDYRNRWLEYAFKWLRKNDASGHLEMPASRMITCPNESAGSYRANSRSADCPIGYSQEETIKTIWNTNLSY